MNIYRHLPGFYIHCFHLGLIGLIFLGFPQLSNALVSRGVEDAPTVTVEGGGEFLVEMYQGGSWQPVGILSYKKILTEKTLDLAVFAKADEVQIRVSHSGKTAAHIDSIFLGDMPPLTVTGAAERTRLALLKLARRDYDVIDAEGKSLLMTFKLKDTIPVLSLTARIEPEHISKIPFMFPLENILTEINSASSHFYLYDLNSNDGKFTIDGDLAAEGLGEPFFKVFSRTGSGHPSDYTYGWVRNDDSNLYVAIDFVPDNTMDGEKDFTAVYVNSPDGVRTFKASMTERNWGVPGFTYTSHAAYQHKTYEFQIPFAEIGIEGIKKGGHVELAFAAYGTAAGGFDWGDAPDTYGTLLPSNGASHGPDQWGYWYLGHCNDLDPDGLPSVLADGDDTTSFGLEIPFPGACQTPGDDEDGVTFPNLLIPGQNAEIEVSVALEMPGDTCFVSAYMDFNSDGDFFDAGEKVLDLPLPPGVHLLPIVVPPDAVIGTTYARFRCSSTPSSSPIGNMPDGEVEDYMIQISPAAEEETPVIVPLLMPLLFK